MDNLDGWMLLDGEQMESITEMTKEEWKDSHGDGYCFLNSEKEFDSFGLEETFSLLDPKGEAAWEGRFYVNKGTGCIEERTGEAGQGYACSIRDDATWDDEVASIFVEIIYKKDTEKFLISYLEDITEDESRETIERLDDAMSTINCIVDIKREYCSSSGNWDYYPFVKDGLNRIRDSYIIRREELTHEYSTAACFTKSGDNPVIYDQAYQWDMKNESAGGFSRLDPTNEPDFLLRNDLEKDTSILRQAEIKQIGNKKYTNMWNTSDRGSDYQKMIMAQKDERIARYERLRDHIIRTQTVEKINACRSTLNARYFQSISECKKKNDFTKILLTKKQKDDLNELCITLVKGFSKVAVAQ